jgi:hypothetical protein
VAKHLAQAEILFREARTGYPHHMLRAIGHMEEAAQESEAAYPDLSQQIYAERKNAEDPTYAPDIEPLLKDIHARMVPAEAALQELIKKATEKATEKAKRKGGKKK